MPVSNTSSDVQLWATGAGGGNEVASVDGDAGTSSGSTGFNLSHFYQNTTDNPATTNTAEGFFRPSDIVFDTVHGKFFIADSDLAGHNRILQGNISDLLSGAPPAMTILYNDPAAGTASRIDNLEINPNTGTVYFTHGQRFEKVSYDSANQVPTILMNFGAGSGNPAGTTNNFFNDVAIDFTTGDVYLSSTRVGTSPTGDSIQKNYIYHLSGLTGASGAGSFSFAGGTASLLPFSPQDNEVGTTPPLAGEAFPMEQGSLDGLAIDTVTHTLYIATGSVNLNDDSNTSTPPVHIPGGIFTYALNGNPSGTYTEIFEQNASNGPQGQMSDLEIDPTSGRWYVADITGGTAAPGDEAIWTGKLDGTGTPTQFALINNAGGEVPAGFTLDIAPTVTGSSTGAVATETAGPGSGFSAPVQPITGVVAGDYENADQTDQLSGAHVRISSGFGSSPGSAEQLTIAGTTSGTLGSGIAYSYNSLTGVMTLTGVNTLANYQAALALVSYSISGDNPDNYGASTTRTISYSVSDGLLTSDEENVTVTIGATNDAPVNTTGGTVSTSEDTASVPITGLSVSDVDSSSLTVTLAVGRGTLTVDTGVSGGVSGGQVSGNGSGSVVLTGTQAQINATLAAATGLAYTPTANLNGADSLTMTTDDGSAQDVDSVTINVAAVNDAPVVTGDGTESATPIVEDTPSATGQSVASLFGGQYSDATDQVAGGSSADAFAGIAVTANGSSGATGQWQYFNGSSWVDIGPASDSAAVLISAGTSIRFNPAANFNGAAPTLTTHLVDASGGALTDGGIANASVTGGTTRYSSGTVVLDESVGAVNDAPVNTTGGPISTNEDTSVAVTGLSVSDVDASGVISVTLAVNHGALTVATGVSGGLTAGQVSGNGSGTVVLSGTQSEIDATLAAMGGVTYAPAANFNGSDSLTMTSSDGSAQDIDVVPITVTAVNDAPVVTGDGTESAAPIVEDMPSATGQSVASLFGGQYADPADGDAFAGIAVTANGSSGATGQWQYFNGSSWVDIGAASNSAAVLISAGTSIRFNPAANFNGAAPTLTTHLVDASGGALTDGTVADVSVSGGSTRYSGGTVVLDESVTAANDAPVNTTGGPIATNEDTTVAVTGLSVTDVDASGPISVTLAVTHGALTVATGVPGGLTPGEVSGNGTGTVVLTGTQGEIDTTLAAMNGLTYAPAANFNGSDSLTMTSSDGSAQDIDVVGITVAPINDAPTVVGDGTESAAPIVQDTPSPTGQTVASLFAGQYSDAADQVTGGSSADAFAGVAVTANGSSGATGQWQYFNGSSWVNIGAASNGAAVLLASSTSVRFNPAAGFSGAAPTLTTHLVDASGGALTSGSVADASVTGGITRYSGGTVLLDETVIPGNTPPTGVTGNLHVGEDANNGTVVGTVVATDPDSTTFTYTLVNDAGGRFDISAGGVVTVQNGLLLDYEQAHNHTIRVQVDDHEGGVSQFDMSVGVTDVHGEFVTGDNANNVFYGGVETDILLGGHGVDTIHGGGGIDIITGGMGLIDSTDDGDFLFGEGGSDVIDGNGGNDVIAGGADSDVIVGGYGNDTIYGGDSATDTTETGNDVLSGDWGNDIIYGNGGNDFLYGGDDLDQLFGGAGADTLDGGSGNDTLRGGTGADDLTGGSGNDVFVFHKGEANGDVIEDFTGNGSGVGDTIRLEGYAAGTTFTRVGHTDTWRINDHGTIETVTIHGTVHSTDYHFF